MVTAVATALSTVLMDFQALVLYLFSPHPVFFFLTILSSLFIILLMLLCWYTKGTKRHEITVRELRWEECLDWTRSPGRGRSDEGGRQRREGDWRRVREGDRANFV